MKHMFTASIKQILTPWRPALFVSEHDGTSIDGRAVSCGTSQFFLDPLQNDRISTSPGYLSRIFKMYSGLR